MWLAWLVLACGPSEPELPPPAPPLPPARAVAAPTDEVGRIVVLAIDGAEWSVIRPMVDQGDLPTIAALQERGCHGTMESLESSRSAVIWTSVATGVPPEVHGIVDFAYEEDGRKRLYLSDKLAAPPVWEMLSDGGVSVGVTNWWVTYPVVPVRGYMVSDHFIPSASLITARTFATDAEAPARDVASLVYPAPLNDALVQVLRARLPTDNDPALFAAIDDIFARDAESADMARRAARAFSPKVELIYLKGIDLASHYLWGFFRPQPGSPEMPRPTARDIAVYRALIPSKYRHTDALLGELLADLRPEDMVILLSDHGFGHRKRLRDVDPQQFMRGFHRGTHGPHALPATTDGIFLIAGGPVSPAHCPDRFSLYDVAPTLLHLAGQQVPSYLGGRVLTELLGDEFQARHPIVRGPPDTPVRARRQAVTPDLTEAERQQIEGLRTLGYFE